MGRILDRRRSVDRRIRLWITGATAVLLLVLAGCASYYVKNRRFHEYFGRGDMEKALAELEGQKGSEREKSTLLHLLQTGVVLHMLDRYEESNEYFEQAYLYVEDYRRNYAAEALSLISNPTVIPYRGEDFEVVLIHYYKALNFLMMNRLDEALVECRRINIRLNQLNDRYENRKNRYADDAFAHVLMGLIFEAGGDINDAFIAYRNAFETYTGAYSEFFGTGPPEQLEEDLMRTAYLLGFREELREYERLFGREYEHRPAGEGRLFFFWNTGLGPVKGEWSVNFFLVHGSGGMVTFRSDELDTSFPFDLDRSGYSRSSLGDLKAVRVAFPKYRERPPVYTDAVIETDERRYPLEEVEDINAIAFATLEDRMLREFGMSLLRLAVKQAAEYGLRKKSDGLGALLSIANAVTEKADTRNWQTLPHSVSYAVVPLNAGVNTVTFECPPARGAEAHTAEFEFDVIPGGTKFFLYHTLESLPPEP